MPSFASLKGEYARLWDAMTIPAGRLPALDAAARTMIANRPHYEAVAVATGVPWAFIACLHWRESSGDFSGILHNGEEIIGTGRKTVKAPKGRGPFATWDEAAIDALRYDKLDQVDAWGVERCLYQAEIYNGMGYRMRDLASPYLWSFTSNYAKGKFVEVKRDGKYVSQYRPTLVDQQPGVAALMQRLMVLDPTVTFASASPTKSASADAVRPAAPAKVKVLGPGDFNSAEVKALQQLLRDKGYAMVGIPDGDWGTDTKTAITAFQRDNGLPATGLYDLETAATLPTAPVRSVGAMRAAVTVQDLRAAGSPEAKANLRNKVAAIAVGAPAAAGALLSGAASQIGTAAGYISSAKAMVAGVPDWVWLAGVASIAVAIWWNSQRADAAKVQAVRTGQDPGPAGLANVVAPPIAPEAPAEPERVDAA